MENKFFCKANMYKNISELILTYIVYTEEDV